MAMELSAKQLRWPPFALPLALTSAALALSMILGCAPTQSNAPVSKAAYEPIRAVWVTRFHYRTAADIAQIMRNIRDLGANTVLWQTRGEGTVAYPSQLEPWSFEYGYQHPGFDPLATAVREAHSNGLKIHAWCNTLTGWKTNRAQLPGQLFTMHPEWFIRDKSGRIPTGAEYFPMNPCLPEARAHIVSVFEEIATNYDVDGIQLDYVRYVVDDQKERRDQIPSDPATLDLYKRQTGQSPGDDLPAWHHWRAAQITQLVRETREMLTLRRPDVMLSASVWASPVNGYREFMQNAVSWVNVGLLDAVFTMTYMPDATAFATNVALYRDNCPNARIIPGIGLYKHARGNQTADQMKLCGGWGPDVALYSYDSLFDGLTEKPNAKTKAERTERRTAIAPFFSKYRSQPK